MDVAGQNWEGATVEDEVAAASRRIPVTKISLRYAQYSLLIASGVCTVQSINSLRYAQCSLLIASGMHSTVY